MRHQLRHLLHPQLRPHLHPHLSRFRGTHFWKPIKTRFGTGTLAAGTLGCILLLVGIAAGNQTALLGLTLICLALALLCWRHGSRPGTDAAFLGGSVFLFIFATVFFAQWLQSAPSGPRAPVAAEIPQRPVGKLTPLQAEGPPKTPLGKLTPVPRLGSHDTSKNDSIRTARKRNAAAEQQSPEKNNVPRSDPGNVVQSTEGIETPVPAPPRSNTPLPERMAVSKTGPSYVLNSSEQYSIESACSYAKNVEGPASYYRCVENQQAALAAGPRRPDLSRLNSSEQYSIESACSYAKNVEGPASYYRCLENQLAALAAAPRHPDVSGLSSSEQYSIESACSYSKNVEGPASYYRCLHNQLAALAAAPRRPDLSGLDSSERYSIESACSYAKNVEGPASYYRCLVRQLQSLKKYRR